ncbi:stage III sporulation protein AF [Clostridium pascui]|uniref:stage III sporulation protein AF n=1 Tax=Clostridium pascui TaxID=46609 RepID=UPI00195972BD|nr:stage III sporulation protein AF [Clostridium pascui]MBM7869211.1 stage III sporulation protein AF [Clostridium pascui]
MEIIKAWISNICTVVLFITAVEIILPDNSLKKYAKFVLGLILMTVIINPIMKVYDKNFDINVMSSNVEKSIEIRESKSNMEEYKKNNLNATLETFNSNLKKLSEEKLREKFKDMDFEVRVKSDIEHNQVKITSIEVGSKEKGIQKIKKVAVESFKSEKENANESERLNEVKQFLSKELNIQEKLIKIYQL